MYQIAIPLIGQFEGLVLHPYFCSAKKLTIGYGEVILDDRMYGNLSGRVLNDDGDQVLNWAKGNINSANGVLSTRYPNLITKELASERLAEGVKSRWRTVSRSLPSGLTDHQCAAIASFVYNLGTGAFLASNLLTEIIKNNKSPAVGKQFMRFINAGGRPNQGLKNRREQEVKIYYTGI